MKSKHIIIIFVFFLLIPIVIGGEDLTVEGYIRKNDGTRANNAEVVVRVQINSEFGSDYYCYCETEKFNTIDGYYTDDLGNLKYSYDFWSKKKDQPCYQNWRDTDLIWVEADGSTMSPPQGKGSTILIGISSLTSYGIAHIPDLILSLPEEEVTLPSAGGERVPSKIDVNIVDVSYDYSELTDSIIFTITLKNMANKFIRDIKAKVSISEINAETIAILNTGTISMNALEEKTVQAVWKDWEVGEYNVDISLYLGLKLIDLYQKDILIDIPKIPVERLEEKIPEIEKPVIEEPVLKIIKPRITSNIFLILILILIIIANLIWLFSQLRKHAKEKKE